MGSISIDFIEPEALGLAGRIGLTTLPQSDTDIARLKDEYAVDRLITLIEYKYQATAIWQWAQQARIINEWFAINDFDVPTDMDAYVELIDGIVEALEDGETVAIHCLAGLGRTGMVAASILAALGKEPKEAIEAVREVRKGSVQTKAQEKFVKKFHKAWSKR